VLLPTPDGPERTVRPAGTGAGSCDRVEPAGSAMMQLPRPRAWCLTPRAASRLPRDVPRA